MRAVKYIDTLQCIQVQETVIVNYPKYCFIMIIV